MAKCRKCGQETNIPGKYLCDICLSKWTDMKTIIFNTLQNKYGKLNKENHPIFMKESKRLVRIWRKDKDKFNNEINKLK